MTQIIQSPSWRYNRVWLTSDARRWTGNVKPRSQMDLHQSFKKPTASIIRVVDNDGRRHNVTSHEALISRVQMSPAYTPRH
jgi:hypothetical protein